MTEAKEGLKTLLAVLGRHRIRYYLVGSLASAIHGIYRFTNDIDIVADIQPGQVDALCQDLQPSFYADAEMIRSSFRHGRAFNVIHFQSSYKFDIFPALPGAFQESQMRRSSAVDLSLAGLEGVQAQTASPEDTILSKLSWYRQGSSEQQWKDLMGIVRVQAEALDRDYLRHWAAHLGVEDLLDELLK